MSSTFRPVTLTETRDVIAWAAGGNTPLELVAGGTKRALGRPFQAEHTLDLSGLAGINFYEPAELVLSAAAATPLREIEDALRQAGQMLAFEPIDPGALFGGAPGAGTIGGVFACNLSGPRRIKAGAARDHLLGFNAVSGRGDSFKSGGRVVKNVTGYDLSKLVCGSFGTLAAVTEVTFKVLPAPEKTRTILVHGLDGAAATGAMSCAMNSPHEVAGAAHLPAPAAARSAVGRISASGDAVTAVRLEGFGPSVEQRCRDLRAQLSQFGETDELHTSASLEFWQEVRDVILLPAPEEHAVWRISVPPSHGHRVVETVGAALDIHAFLDWAGGLVWLSAPVSADAGAALIREAITESGGHATLFRAPPDVRAMVPVFQPQPAALAALSRRVKESFDPARILNPGRMAPGV